MLFKSSNFFFVSLTSTVAMIFYSLFPISEYWDLIVGILFFTAILFASCGLTLSIAERSFKNEIIKLGFYGNLTIILLSALVLILAIYDASI